MKGDDSITNLAYELNQNEYIEMFYELCEKDQEHSKRVRDLSLKIAYALDCRINLETLNIAGLYHDIGKTLIPPAILYKNGKLTVPEMVYMKKHANWGSKILSCMGFNKEIVQTVMLHHENFDGSGYPLEYSGTGIPIEARIIRVADVFDALHSVRAYKDAYPIDICIEIMKGEQNKFDPIVFEALKKVL